jgi:branched-chain amino acid transport system permease protein
MGNVAGAAVVGLLLGVIESLTSAYLSNSMRDIVGFVIVIGVLLFLPNGLFGKAVDRS